MTPNRTTRRGFPRKPAQRPAFLVKRDSVTVRVRFSPLKNGKLWYESWIIAYSLQGRRVRERRNTERRARAWAEAIAAKLAAGEMAALELRGDDRRIYLAAKAALNGLEVPLDAAAREYADAKRLAKNTDLRELARFHQKYARARLQPITVPDLAKKMLATLEQDKRGHYHLRDLEIRLGRFARDFPGQVSEVSTEQIEHWLRNLKSLGKGMRCGGPLKSRSRNNYRNAIVALFNFARKHGYLPRDLATEASGTNRVPETDKRNNEIFTPDQIDDLLNHAPVRLIPGLAIKAFSGVRTEEMALMEWEHVQFRKGYIILPKVITKKKRRRILPLLPNLRKWIGPFEGLTGRICQDWSTPQSVFQAWDRFAVKRGIKAGENRFRNSYISYRVAQVSDPAKVALETGNSAEVIMEDYLELTTPEEAARWFNVSPSKEQMEAIAVFAAQLHSAQHQMPRNGMPLN